MRAGLIAIAVLFTTLLTLQTAPAEARKYRFGDVNKIHFIQDVTIKGAEGEALFLGHMTTTKNFLAPYMMSDDGYVLGVKGSESYYELKPEKISEFQGKGLLPKPLPAYEIAPIDWAFGFLLPIIIIGLIVFYGLKRLLFGRKSEA
ncbi:MAG: hypothetical protein ACR2O4_02405 [Hyphomicrobiaceae bacterium]